MARDIRVSFKMSEEKKDELQEYSDSYGVTMSSLCALIIGQWLHQQTNVQKPMIQAITDSMVNQLGSLKPDDMKQLLSTMSEQDRA